jgi:hypothetical protein
MLSKQVRAATTGEVGARAVPNGVLYKSCLLRAETFQELT